MGEKLLQAQMLSMGGAALIAKITCLDIVHFLTLHHYVWSGFGL